MIKTTLPTGSEARKNIPIVDGCLRYIPAALAGMARWSKEGNDKHNPGEPLHHARGKSGDHANCIVRHLMDINDILAGIERESHTTGKTPNPERVRQLMDEVDALFWRAGVLSQELHERFDGAPLAPGAKLPELSQESLSKDETKARALGVCGRQGPQGCFCSLPPGHAGDHRAYFNHDLIGGIAESWMRYEVVYPRNR